MTPDGLGTPTPTEHAGLGEHADPHARRWWQLVAQHRLCVQRCDSCGHTQHPPGPVCRHCHLIDQLGWADHDRRGRLVSATHVHRTTSPAYAGRVPYWLGLVDLGAHLHTLALLTPPARSTPVPGAVGTVGFTEVADRTVLTFHPDPARDHD